MALDSLHSLRCHFDQLVDRDDFSANIFLQDPSTKTEGRIKTESDHERIFTLVNQLIERECFATGYPPEFRCGKILRVVEDLSEVLNIPNNITGIWHFTSSQYDSKLQDIYMKRKDSLRVQVLQTLPSVEEMKTAAEEMKEQRRKEVKQEQIFNLANLSIKNICSASNCS